MNNLKNIKQRAWYKIELFIGKGGISMFYALGIVLVATMLFLLAVRYLMAWSLGIELPTEGDFWQNTFHIFMEVTDSGTMGNFLEKSIWLKFTGIVTGMSGIVIFSMLVAMITTALEKMLNTFRQGTTDVYEKGHYLIIGNNSRLTDILNEFVVASEFQKHTVVILSETPKEEVDLAIELAVKESKNLRIITRTGKVTSPTMLERVSVDTAKAIIVLSSCENFSDLIEKDQSDTKVIKICYALSIAINKEHPIMVIPEVYESANRDIIATILNDKVLQIDANSFLSRLLVQTSLFNGLVGVYENLFSFEGSELYFIKNTIGKIKFGEISFHLQDGIVIGYKCPEKGLVINPSPDVEVNENQRLIAVMSDSTKYSYQSKRVQEPSALKYVSSSQQPLLTSILIIGWNSETASIIKEYDKYITANSNFKLLLSENTELDEDVVADLRETITAKLEIVRVEVLDEKYLKNIDLFSFDMLVVLTAFIDSKHTTDEVDSANIKFLLLVKKILANNSDKKRPLIVSEVQDTSNLELFNHMGISDFLLSNRLISIFLTQLAKQPELIDVYERLLSKDGAEIYIKPIANYLENPDGEYTFADLLLLCQQRKDIVIGYKIILEKSNAIGRNYDVVLNPPKNQKIKLTNKDFLIVISDEN